MWRKSSKSNSGSTCVEVRHDLAALRDSKQPDGPPLTARLAPFIRNIKAGRFDR